MCWMRQYWILNNHVWPWTIIILLFYISRKLQLWQQFLLLEEWCIVQFQLDAAKIWYSKLGHWTKRRSYIRWRQVPRLSLRCLPWLRLVTLQLMTQTFPPRGRVNEYFLSISTEAKERWLLTIHLRAHTPLKFSTPTVSFTQLRRNIFTYIQRMEVFQPVDLLFS